jgi:hypothetical protein
VSGYAHLSDDRLRAIGRLRCLVPGCGRTFKCGPEVRSTICGKHWRLADQRHRLLMSKVHRKAKRAGWSMALVRLHDRLWRLCSSQAIERAMGL